MPSAEFSTDVEFVHRVNRFYDNIRNDGALETIFQWNVKNWDTHFSNMVGFWSSVLQGTAQFRGAPMPKHAVLPGFIMELFQRSVMLFNQATDVPPNAALGERAKNLVKRIAQSLWLGNKLNQYPGQRAGVC